MREQKGGLGREEKMRRVDRERGEEKAGKRREGRAGVMRGGNGGKSREKESKEWMV